MMKTLFLHSDFIEVIPRSRALKDAEEISESVLRVEEALVCFVSIEKTDTENVVEEFKNNVKEIATKVGAKRIVIYPFVHLTNIPSDPKKALDILRKIEKSLKEEYEVYRAPFGWYKEFNIRVKGHPLSELSRMIKDKEKIIDDIIETLEVYKKLYNVDLEYSKRDNKLEINIRARDEKKEEEKIDKPSLIMLEDGRDYIILGEEDNKIKVVPYEVVKDKNIYKIKELNIDSFEYLDKSQFNEDFIKMVDKEALGKPFQEIDRNIIREALEKFGFEWEENSDYGHMRYKPYAALLMDLVADYSINIAKELEFPVYVIKGTNMFDLEQGPVAEHAKLYGERLYELQTDKSRFVLRYAACFQQFTIAKDLIISYKHLPFGMLEIADSYRFEQPGEVVLGFRMRKFYMPDLHIFTKDLEEARKVFLTMHRKIMEEIKKIGRDYELLINIGSKEFYDKYKYLVLDIVKDIKKPVLIQIYPPADERYWILNIEYHIIDIYGRAREIGTTQIDIGNGERFKIKYIDKNNEEKTVVILHNAIIGSIERYIYAIFDTALRKEKPVLPLWLSPVQVRIIPVSEEYNSYAMELAKELMNKQIRVEVDDRDLTVGKKIMEAERMWIPYIIVVGEKEKQSGKLSIRKRETGENIEMSLEDLIKEINEKLEGFPKRVQYWPVELSKRPSGI